MTNRRPLAPAIRVSTPQLAAKPMAIVLTGIRDCFIVSIKCQAEKTEPPGELMYNFISSGCSASGSMLSIIICCTRGIIVFWSNLSVSISTPDFTIDSSMRLRKGAGGEGGAGTIVGSGVGVASGIILICVLLLFFQ